MGESLKHFQSSKQSITISTQIFILGINLKAFNEVFFALRFLGFRACPSGLKSRTIALSKHIVCYAHQHFIIFVCYTHHK